MHTVNSDLFASVDAGRGIVKKQERIQVPILYAALLLCNEPGYHFQISNVGILFKKGICQKLISKAVDLTLVPD